MHNSRVNSIEVPLILLILVQIAYPNVVIPPALHGTFVHDLYGSSEGDFAAMASQWTFWNLLPGVTSVIMPCDPNALNGPGISESTGSFERTYEPLPSHDFIYFSVTFYMLDDWQSGDTFSVQFDGQTPIVLDLVAKKNLLQTPFCGNPTYDDFRSYLFIKLAHSDTSINVKFSYNIANGPYLASFAIRDVTMEFRYRSAEDTEGYFVLHASDPDPNMLSCPDSDLCPYCDPSCNFCFGPAAYQCYYYKAGYYFDGSGASQCTLPCGLCSTQGCSTCASGYALFWDSTCQLDSSCSSPNVLFQNDGSGMEACQTQCQATDTYLNWDNTCQSSCSYPYLPKTEGGAKFCDFPCTATTGGEYLYWDNTCKPVCIYNTVERNGYKFCETPCQHSGTYLNWDNTCQSSCNSPYLPRTVGNARFCDFPCTAMTGEYLYWDSSCQPTCPFYIKLESGHKFCLPCQEGYFRYPDTKCLPSCPAIFPQYQKIGPTTICEYPCQSSSSYYYIEDGSCKTYCEYPYATRETLLCALDISQEDLQQIQTLSDITNTGSASMTITAAAASLIDFTDPDAMCSTSLIKMLWYIRYMKVKYPPKLQRVLDLQKFESGLTTYMPAVPSGISENIISFPLPEKFERYKHNSNFLINFWTSLILMLIILAVIVLCLILNCFFEGTGTVHMICKKAKDAVQWNLFLMIFISFYDSLVLYSSFEFRTLSFYNALAVISFILCICINLVGAGVLYGTVRIINAFRSSVKRIYRRRQTRYVYSSESKWQSYQFLLANYKEAELSQQVFIPIFMIRISVYNAVIGYLFDHPLIQAIFLTVLSVLILVYLILRAPMKLIFKQIQQLIQELIIFVVNICVLILAIMDSAEKTSYDVRKVLGDIVIGCNIVFPIISSTLAGLNTIAKIWAYYKVWRAKKNVSRLGGPTSHRVKQKHEGINLPNLDMARVLRKPVVSQLEREIGHPNATPIEQASVKEDNNIQLKELDKIVRKRDNLDKYKNARIVIKEGNFRDKIAKVLMEKRLSKKKGKDTKSKVIEEIQIQNSDQSKTNITTVLDESTLPPQKESYAVQSRQVFKLSEILRQNIHLRNETSNNFDGEEF